MTYNLGEDLILRKTGSSSVRRKALQAALAQHELVKYQANKSS